jgi:hypothetical protein
MAKRGPPFGLGSRSNNRSVGALDKSEGGVKDKSILSVFLAPFFLPERLRTKTLEISR